MKASIGAVLRLFFAGRRRLLWSGIALAALTVFAGMGLLGLSGWFITATALAGLAAGTALAFDVFTPGAGIRLLALVRTAARYGERVVTHDAALAVIAALRPRLFAGWARPEAARKLLARPARLLFRLTADADALDALYLRVLVPAGAACAAIALAGVALGVISLPLGLAMAGWLLAAGAGILAWTMRRSRRAACRRAHALEALRAQAIDLVSGQTELAMAGQLAQRCRLLARTEHRLAAADDTINRADTQGGFLQAMAGTLAMGATLAACVLLVAGSAIGAPVAALALLLVLASAEPLTPLRRGILELGRTLLAIRRLAPRLDAPAAPPPRAASGDIRLEHASLGHESRPGLPAGLALADVTLVVRPGERVAVVGPSGAGKSTLLALVAGERLPSGGRVQAPASCLLTQRTELFQDSVRDNLRLARPDASDDELWAALRAAGLDQAIAALPAGLDTRLGEGGLGLSAGQARRLALARLFLRPTRLWLLDEPTEGLDAPTARDVVDRLAGQAHGRTLLIATHIRREAALADRIVVLAAGIVAADLRRGTPAFDHQLHTLRPD
ncbi:MULTISPECIES: amino acid ABC transporter ATP-binding/permease protein [unclassified Pigmentiphaga]|uniref:amino acid ABC transporter ATP-binding/permease protein n=1 Tax=unclassified Pigmentiphaga TaxID=2626614 RepID=UPI000B408D65|nr:MULTISPECIES: ATP-binding cassette domain-containing protein [unclassified Pigmentiphaga]OVZ58650.1 ABC transporter ATP-binding protein [Pigmentiphaga sp. NML030171]